jgi:hypothetical protein
MAGPLITAARERFRENHPVIAAAIRAGAQEVAADPTTAATRADVPAMQAAIEDHVGALVENATNQEPWWKSRIWVGIITAAFGVLLGRLNIQFTGNEQALINQITPYVPQVLGLAIAGVGRAVGNRRGPIVWWRPWTIIGIGS